MTTSSTPKTPPKADPQRFLAFEALAHCLNPQKRLQVDSFLSNTFKKRDFSGEQRQFTTHLTYSLCRYWFAMDPVLAQWLKKPLQKLDTRTQILLKLGLIQLSDICKTPAYAALESTLSIAETIGFDKPRRGFLTAILQNAARQSENWRLEPENLLPPWLFQKQPDIRQALISALTEPPKGIGIRVNTLKISPEDFKAKLNQAEIAYADTPLKDSTWLQLPEVRLAEQIPGYEEGHFMPQDRSANEVALCLAPEHGESILELGASPGGKTTHLASLMANTGSILALDNNAKRMPLLNENLERLGVSNTITACVDLCKEPLEKLNQTFDRILIDAPCSASGIIRRHPDVLLQLTPNDATKHNATQLGLLENVWPHLKQSGTLVYATCSLFDAENRAIIDLFLNKTPEAILVNERIILPSPKQDGFYIVKLQKP